MSHKDISRTKHSFINDSKETLDCIEGREQFEKKIISLVKH